MARFLLILAAVSSVSLFSGGAAQGKEDTSQGDFHQPNYVWIDACGEEPEEYAYVTVGRRSWNTWSYDLEWSAGGCPSVMREVNAPGYASATFRFYDENDRLIRSVSKSVYVDDYGISYPEGFDTGYWGHDRWYRPRSYGSTDSDGQNMSLYDNPWPEVELGVELSGDGHARLQRNYAVGLEVAFQRRFTPFLFIALEVGEAAPVALDELLRACPVLEILLLFPVRHNEIRPRRRCRPA